MGWSRALLGRALGAVFDPTIVLSFGRQGFAAHALAFPEGELEVDLAGRRALVTGANSGLGFATAQALADRGADVVLLCRSASRGEEARDRLLARHPRGTVELVQLDVSDLRQVREVGGRLAAGKVDVLVHNAGVLPDARAESKEGHELTFATHLLGPHALTTELLPALRRSADARVIWVSSGGMYTRRLRLDDFAWKERAYDGVIAYAETKRAQVVLAGCWAGRLADTNIVVSSMHPGWADTPAIQSSLPRFHALTGRLLRTPEEGADSIVWLAVAERARAMRGAFVFDRVARSEHYLPWTRESAAERDALWELVDAAA